MKGFQATWTAKELMEYLSKLLEAFSVLHENEAITPADEIASHSQMRAVGVDSTFLLENVDCCFC